MPPHHHRIQQIRGFNNDDLLVMAERTGQATRQAAALMLQNSIYIKLNYKAFYGMLLLAKKYSGHRLEATCSRVLQGTRMKYTMIKSIMERQSDQVSPEQIPLLDTRS